MIKGEKINLRLIQEKDLDILFQYWSDLENRGDYFPIFLHSESQFKRDFQEGGFWKDDFGRFLITDKNDRIVGSIWFFNPTTTVITVMNQTNVLHSRFSSPSFGRQSVTATGCAAPSWQAR